MKTTEEILNDFVNDNYELSIKDALQAMKIYANKKLDEAAEKATASADNDFGLIIVNKQSILSLKDEL